MKAIKSITLVILCVLFFSLCFAQAQEINETTQNDIQVRVGDIFSIKLQSNPTTGYEWYFFQPLDNSMVELVKRDSISDKPVREGSGGIEIFTFKALKVGKTMISMEYVRKLNRGKEGARNFRIDIIERKE